MPVAPYTVTNSFKGGLMMKTYGRNVRRAWDGQDFHIQKRLCVERPHMIHEIEDNLERAVREASTAVSSSPSRKNSTIFSLESQDDDSATPPSSPPPQLSPPVVKVRKPTFSSLKRKRAPSLDTSDPASESIQVSSRQKPQPPKPQNLQQTRLDLGGDTRKSCAECGMEFIPSNEEDALLHKMYHNMNSDGIELGKAFTKSAMKWGYTAPGIDGLVVIVNPRISPPARKIVQKVMGVVNKELGAAEIDEDTLWSQKPSAEVEDEEAEAQKQSEPERRNKPRQTDRYKLFLHVISNKCVGACLAERITKAYRVKPAAAVVVDPAASGLVDPAHQSSSITVEEEACPAEVGVSRIWTSKAFRRRGIAANLLDVVMKEFIYAFVVPKDEFAFSQPTQSGGLLARSFYGSDSGWLVYHEE